jgi:MFS family permease
MRTRNIPILSVSQALASCGPAILVLLGGIIGAEIAPRPTLATLPMALMVVGTAIFTIPAAMIMKAIGRRRGFTGAAIMAGLAALLLAYATSQENFLLFCIGTVFIGANGAFMVQYRFAASESVAPQFAGKAVSFTLLGGVAAGFLGPEIVKWSKDWLPAAGLYVGSFVSLAILYALAALNLSFLKDILLLGFEDQQAERPLIEIVSQPTYQVAVLAAVVAYGVMVFVMTAAPIQMHNLSGFSLNQTALVIQSHIIAMYLPSLATGVLLERLGLLRVMLMGVASLMASVSVGFFSLGFAGYWATLVLLGLGWNFLFVGATVLLTRSYLPGERFKAQATNDFAVFGVQALGSLSAGTILFVAGWETLTLVTIPFLLLIFLAILLLRQRLLPAASQA